MGRIRCSHCNRKVDSGFDYCPSCGARLAHDTGRSDRHGGGRMWGMIALCLLIVGCATVATVWLVREKGREEASRELVRQRRDSMKAAEIVRLRRMSDYADSLHAVAEARAERERLESQMYTLADFVVEEGGSASIRPRGEIVRSLRERGYSTLRREQGDRCVVMGLNAEIRGGRIAPKGEVCSAAGLWEGRVEMLFSDTAATSRFMSESVRWGFERADAGGTARHKRNARLALRRHSPTTVELSER